MGGEGIAVLGLDQSLEAEQVRQWEGRKGDSERRGGEGRGGRLDWLGESSGQAGRSPRTTAPSPLPSQHDRYNLTLPPSQAALYDALRSATAARGVPLVVVLLHGGALAIEDLVASADAILDAHYPGVSGAQVTGGWGDASSLPIPCARPAPTPPPAQAVAGALFGDVNPSGKLTYTVFRASFAGAAAAE